MLIPVKKRIVGRMELQTKFYTTNPAPIESVSTEYKCYFSGNLSVGALAYSEVVPFVLPVNLKFY